MEDEMYPESGATPPKPEPSEKEETGETFLVPKSTFGEKKPGDKCQVEIVSAFDDEYEVRYVKHEEKEKPKPEMSAEEEIRGMAKGEE